MRLSLPEKTPHSHFIALKYFEVVVHPLELEILNEKVEVLFYKIKNRIKPLTFLLNILGSRDCMTPSKNLFDRTRSKL